MCVLSANLGFKLPVLLGHCGMTRWLYEWEACAQLTSFFLYSVAVKEADDRVHKWNLECNIYTFTFTF